MEMLCLLLCLPLQTHPRPFLPPPVKLNLRPFEDMFSHLTSLPQGRSSSSSSSSSFSLPLLPPPLPFPVFKTSVKQSGNKTRERKPKMLPRENSINNKHTDSTTHSVTQTKMATLLEDIQRMVDILEKRQEANLVTNTQDTSYRLHSDGLQSNGLHSDRLPSDRLHNNALHSNGHTYFSSSPKHAKSIKPGSNGSTKIGQSRNTLHPSPTTQGVEAKFWTQVTAPSSDIVLMKIEQILTDLRRHNK